MPSVLFAEMEHILGKGSGQVAVQLLCLCQQSRSPAANLLFWQKETNF